MTLLEDVLDRDHPRNGAERQAARALALPPRSAYSLARQPVVNRDAVPPAAAIRSTTRVTALDRHRRVNRTDNADGASALSDYQCAGRLSVAISPRPASQNVDELRKPCPEPAEDTLTILEDNTRSGRASSSRSDPPLASFVTNGRACLEPGDHEAPCVRSCSAPATCTASATRDRREPSR